MVWHRLGNGVTYEVYAFLSEVGEAVPEDVAVLGLDQYGALADAEL